MSGLSGVGVFWAFSSFLGSIAASVGFYLPYWLSGYMANDIATPVHFGVFRRCNYPSLDENGQIKIIMECGRYTTFADIPSTSWQIATLTIGVGCGLSFLVSVTAMFGLCVKGVVIPTVARTAGIIQMCSGMVWFLPFFTLNLNPVELQWLEHWWLVYHGCFELVLESLWKNPIAADLE